MSYRVSPGLLYVRVLGTSTACPTARIIQPLVFSYEIIFLMSGLQDPRFRHSVYVSSALSSLRPGLTLPALRYMNHKSDIFLSYTTGTKTPCPRHSLRKRGWLLIVSASLSGHVTGRLASRSLITRNPRASLSLGKRLEQRDAYTVAPRADAERNKRSSVGRDIGA